MSATVRSPKQIEQRHRGFEPAMFSSVTGLAYREKVSRKVGILDPCEIPDRQDVVYISGGSLPAPLAKSFRSIERGTPRTLPSFDVRESVSAIPPGMRLPCQKLGLPLTHAGRTTKHPVRVKVARGSRDRLAAPSASFCDSVHPPRTLDAVGFPAPRGAVRVASRDRLSALLTRLLLMAPPTAREVAVGRAKAGLVPSGAFRLECLAALIAGWRHAGWAAFRTVTHWLEYLVTTLTWLRFVHEVIVPDPTYAEMARKRIANDAPMLMEPVTVETAYDAPSLFDALEAALIDRGGLRGVIATTDGAS